MNRWDRLVEGYLQDCEARGLGEETIRGFRSELDRWGCWLKRNRPKVNLERVGHELLIKYIRSRTRFRSKATVVSVVSKMRGMGEYLLYIGVWSQNPMRWIQGPKLDSRGQAPRRIGKEHLKAIWDASQHKRSRYQQHLCLAVLSLLYGTGLRRGELERLDLRDWQRDEGLLVIDGRKTGQERSVPVSEGIWRCIEAYLPLRQNLLEHKQHPEETALLLNRHGERLSAQSLGLLVHRLAREAQVPLVSLHQFRHTCASDLLEGGVSLPEVQRMLGHASVQTTCRYLQVADPERAKAMQRHPINDLLRQPQPSGRAA